VGSESHARAASSSSRREKSALREKFFPRADSAGSRVVRISLLEGEPSRARDDACEFAKNPGKFEHDIVLTAHETWIFYGFQSY
jgi:hypothetical protein